MDGRLIELFLGWKTEDRRPKKEEVLVLFGALVLWWRKISNIEQGIMKSEVPVSSYSLKV
jgi:hypothetical protein